MYIIYIYAHNLNKYILGGINIMELGRQSIIEGILELQKEEEFKLKSAIKSIKLILNEDNISDFDKLKYINSQLGDIMMLNI